MPPSSPPHVSSFSCSSAAILRGMARFYVLTIEPTLFGDVALVREWGRLGKQGRRRLDLFREEAAAREALDVWLARKLQRGYRARAPRAA